MFGVSKFNNVIANKVVANWKYTELGDELVLMCEILF